MAKNKQEINLHSKRYIEAIFEKRLREEGFVCPDDKLLCWYRLKNGEIINSVVFYSLWHKMPLMLSIGYGIHPLFQKPAYSNSVTFPQRPLDRQFFSPQSIVENYPINAMAYAPYSEGIQVMAPGHDGKGVYTFDSILLPQMEAITTIDACYQRHKEDIVNSSVSDLSVKYGAISDVFVDEAIYIGDKEVYQYCAKSINKHIAWFRKCCDEKADKKKYLMELQKWELRKSALLDGTREEYLHILEKNKMDNLAYMKKKHMLE